MEGPDTGHVVYFIAADQWLKVGYSSDVRQRIKQMQTGNPHELDLVMTIGCSSKIEGISREREWRRHMDAFARRRRGEWLWLHPAPPRDPREPIRFVHLADIIRRHTTHADILSGALKMRGLHFPPLEPRIRR